MVGLTDSILPPVASDLPMQTSVAAGGAVLSGSSGPIHMDNENLRRKLGLQREENAVLMRQNQELLQSLEKLTWEFSKAQTKVKFEFYFPLTHVLRGGAIFFTTYTLRTYLCVTKSFILTSNRLYTLRSTYMYK